MNFGSAKARNRKCRPKIVMIVLRPSFRAFSAKELQPLPPGPMAQAFTFRAFGAETRSFDTVATALGSVLRPLIPR
jgi:hypothetical protein